MRHKTKLIIDGVEVMTGAEEGAPAIFAMKLENIACNSPLQMGAVTTDCLDVTISNPFKPSFDGSTVELWISPEESSELDALSEITDEVGDESIDEVIDIEDATEDSDDEEGEALTDEEITDVEETEEADTLEQFEILEGEAFSDSVDESVGEDAEWHKLGTYHVTQQTAVANGVRLLCYDNISRLAIPFSLEADKTLQNEYNRLVGVLADNGITLEAREMPDRNVGTNYTGTCRDALGYFAGLLGGFASCDEDGSIDISSYVVADAVLIAEELLTYIGASAGEMTVGGFVLKDKNGVELASVGDGQSISVVDPLMIDSDLDELMAMYAGLRFEGATLSARWNESLAAGTLVRVFTRAEYENYLKLLNNETITDDIKAMVNSLGKLVLISSQTIVFGGDTTTVIKSVCNSEADKIIQSMSRPIGEKIEAAAETATNYLNQDETGALVISNDKTDGNMRLDYDSVDIRNGDEVVATFSGNKIELGKNSPDSRIEFCGREAVLRNVGLSTILEKSKSLRGVEFGTSDLQLVAGAMDDKLDTALRVGSGIRWLGSDGDDANISGSLRASALKDSASASVRADYSEAGQTQSAEITCKVTESASSISMKASDILLDGDVKVKGHLTPIGSTYSADFEPTTSGKGNISNSWVSETGATLTLSPGTWIITAHAYYKGYTTYNGSTSSSAGARRVRLGYKYTDTGTSGTVTGSTNTTYAPAGNVGGVQTVILRQIATREVQYYPEVYSQNQVGLDNVRMEAVRIA